MPTILVVEDEHAITEMLTIVLEMEGYRVLVAPDGQAALAVLATQRPDLILSDVMMPMMDGRVMVRHVRKMRGCETIPILMMTAGLDPLDDIGHLITAHLPKPMKLDALIHLIGETLTNDQARELPGQPPADEE